MIKHIKLLVCLLLMANYSIAQQHTDQNGLKTSVTDVLSANATQPLRYEIATLGFNSHHWQTGGLVVIELYSPYYSTGYEKYILNVGSGTGVNTGVPDLKLVETAGNLHSAKVTLGMAYDLQTTYGGYINKALPIYVDVKAYAKYKARITYMQSRVDVLDYPDQIKIDVSPNGQVIPDFTVSTMIDNPITSTQNLMIEGLGNHYIANGDVGIGTTTPKEKLSVNGKIRAHEVKVETANWPDYVFEEGYKVETLQALESYIKANKHLPEVPSAKEVAANGVELGEMNKILLKKIEELTLHLIEKDREVRETNHKLKKLSEKVDRLLKSK